MVDMEDEIYDLQSSERLGFADCRQRSMVIAQITGAFSDTDGPHCWELLRITVAVILRMEGRFLNEAEIIIKINSTNEGSKVTKK